MEPYVYISPEGLDDPATSTTAEIIERGAVLQHSLELAFHVDNELNTITYVPRNFQIQLNSINAVEDLMNFCIRLMGKNWVDRIILREFIRLVNVAKGWALQTAPHIQYPEKYRTRL